ncbi:MAG: hypothetical protein V2I51_20650 [Anderseniella sp.]|jgi:hypothetical protein|nr:hypothetical protein [Anderseniella sp.]
MPVEVELLFGGCGFHACSGLVADDVFLPVTGIDPDCMVELVLEALQIPLHLVVRYAYPGEKPAQRVLRKAQCLLAVEIEVMRSLQQVHHRADVGIRLLAACRFVGKRRDHIILVDDPQQGQLPAGSCSFCVGELWLSERLDASDIELFIHQVDTEYRSNGATQRMAGQV